jgi:hypothetical protein
MKRRNFFEATLVSLASFFGIRWEDPTRNLVWTTAEGDRVCVGDMSDAHLRNCIFYLNKRYGYLNPYSIMGGSPAEITPMYDAMRREATRRKLS